MSKLPNQKMKLLYLLKILMEKTDTEHTLTVPEILVNAVASLKFITEKKYIHSKPCIYPYTSKNQAFMFKTDISNYRNKELKDEIYRMNIL